MEAASGGYHEVGRVLINKGADVNAAPVPSSRDTALTIAADKGHFRWGCVCGGGRGRGGVSECGWVIHTVCIYRHAKCPPFVGWAHHCNNQPAYYKAKPAFVGPSSDQLAKLKHKRTHDHRWSSTHLAINVVKLCARMHACTHAHAHARVQAVLKKRKASSIYLEFGTF